MTVPRFAGRCLPSPRTPAPHAAPRGWSAGRQPRCISGEQRGIRIWTESRSGRIRDPGEPFGSAGTPKQENSALCSPPSPPGRRAEGQREENAWGRIISLSQVKNCPNNGGKLRFGVRAVPRIGAGGCPRVGGGRAHGASSSVGESETALRSRYVGRVRNVQCSRCPATPVIAAWPGSVWHASPAPRLPRLDWWPGLAVLPAGGEALMRRLFAPAGQSPGPHGWRQ